MPTTRRRKPTHRRNPRQCNDLASHAAAKTSGRSADSTLDPQPLSGEMWFGSVIATAIEAEDASAFVTPFAGSETPEMRKNAQNCAHFMGVASRPVS